VLNKLMRKASRRDMGKVKYIPSESMMPLEFVLIVSF